MYIYIHIIYIYIYIYIYVYIIYIYISYRYICSKLSKELFFQKKMQVKRTARITERDIFLVL